MFLAAALVAASDIGAAAVYQASPDTYRPLLERLRAGDTLVLAAGEYRDGLPAHRLSGAPDRQIVITGPDRGRPATFHARPGHNTVSIVDSHHLVIRHLVLEGDDVAVDAVKAERSSRASHHVTLEHLMIRGHGNNQQTVGISTKCPVWNWVIRDVTIVGAGTGMYLGDSDGSAPFVAGLIERNVIVDTIGYNLQIKHQATRPDIPGMPEGRSMTIVRHNVFAKPHAGLAASARPNVLVGHFPREGRGVEDDYLIHDNFFYQNRHESLFQGEGNVTLSGNLFVNAYGDAVRIQPHNDIPRRLTVTFNTVLAKGAGIVIAQGTGAPRFRQDVIANTVFAAIPLVGVRGSRNLLASVVDAPAYVGRPFAPPGAQDQRPGRNRVAAVAGPAVREALLAVRGRISDGRPRAAPGVGADARGDIDARSRWPTWLQSEPAAGGERPGTSWRLLATGKHSGESF